MSRPSFSVIGARQHNLKNVTCTLPKDQLVVITGPSGAGKSSLAFDTIHAESYRRYVEFLPSSLRRTMHHLSRPEVDEIVGLPPSIAMKQGIVSPSPRATVGTVTEILDYFRVLFARAAEATCPIGAHPLRAFTAQQMALQLLALPTGTRLTLLTPLHTAASANQVEQTAASLIERGFTRARLNGTVMTLEELGRVELPPKNAVDLVVDRVIVKDGIRARLTDSIELALRQSTPVLFADTHDGGELRFSETLYCPEHDCQLPSPSPALFSHQSEAGWCQTCLGLGHHDQLDPARVVPNPGLTLRQGALAAFGPPGSVAAALLLDELLAAIPLNPDVAWRELTLPGDFWQRMHEVAFADRPEALPGGLTSRELADLSRRDVCPTCEGSRLGSHGRHFQLAGTTFVEFCALPASALLARLTSLSQAFPEQIAAIAPLLEVVERKLGALLELGLDYLPLNAPIGSLSTGETHRVRLSCLLGATLANVLYVVDEPTLGLHPEDARLVQNALHRLTHQGNSVLAVEHSRPFIEGADLVVDMGPGAGEDGGRILAQAAPSALVNDPASVTAPFLFAKTPVCTRRTLSSAPATWLEVYGASAGNLTGFDLRVPKGRLTAITGRSGAGKTSLLMRVLLPSVRATLQRGAPPADTCTSIDGADFSRVVTFDQSPLGQSTRSTPATYCGIWDHLRDLFASLPESRAKGFKAGRFSFNTKGGRCEVCKGEGVVRTELSLLADVLIACSECGGTRFNRETLVPRFRGHNVAEVLDVAVSDAQRLFAHLPKVTAVLNELSRVGLGYLRLGQPSVTLSGGEAQRVRLATELARRGDGASLYLFDEPTSGLHFTDTAKVFDAMAALCDEGHTVVIAEPNPDVATAADWVVELGPHAAKNGGRLLYCGASENWPAPAP